MRMLTNFRSIDHILIVMEYIYNSLYISVLNERVTQKFDYYQMFPK